MAWGSLKTWAVGELLKAGDLNEQIRDHFSELWKYAAKGDIVAATSSLGLARVGVGADGQVLKADSSAAPGVSWTNLRPMFAYGEYGAEFRTNSTTWIDTNIAKIYTPPVPSTLFIVATGSVLAETPGLNAWLRLAVDSTVQGIHISDSTNNANDFGWRPFTLTWQIAATAAAHTIKIQCVVSNTPGYMTIAAGSNINIIAFPS